MENDPVSKLLGDRFDAKLSENGLNAVVRCREPECETGQWVLPMVDKPEDAQSFADKLAPHMKLFDVHAEEHRKNPTKLRPTAETGPAPEKWAEAPGASEREPFDAGALGSSPTGTTVPPTEEG